MTLAEIPSAQPWHTAFAGRRVLVTGHTGFKGSWLAIWLAKLGANVNGLALPPEAQSLFSAARVLDVMTSSRFGDVRDLETITEVFSDARPEVVYHLAAQSLVRRGYEDPVETYGTNVMGTVNLLQAARDCPSVRVIVIVTSDKCYENRESSRSYRETDALGGRDPYSSSKGCAELVTSAFRRSFFSEPGGALVSSARAGNVIGGGDWSKDRLMPDIVRSIARGEPVVIRNPSHIRPWQHVLEPLRGYLMLGARMLDGGSDLAQEWNFGPGDEATISVEDLAAAAIKAWGTGSMTVATDGGGPHEATTLRLDTTKAQSLLGYRSLIDLRTAIEMAVRWYSQFETLPSKAFSLSEDQVDEYMARLD